MHLLCALLLSLLSPQGPESPGRPPTETPARDPGAMSPEEAARRDAASEKLYRLMVIGVGGVTLFLGAFVWFQTRRKRREED